MGAHHLRDDPAQRYAVRCHSINSLRTRHQIVPGKNVINMIKSELILFTNRFLILLIKYILILLAGYPALLVF